MSEINWKYFGIAVAAVAGIGISIIVAVKVVVALSPNAVANKQDVIITIDDDGFRPAEITIPLGATVQWVNNDYQAHMIVSGPFGKKADLPDLNSQQSFGHNGTYEYMPTKKGTFSYYDGDSPSIQGKITVQ